MSKVWAISTSALPAAACKTIWARWTKRAARVRLRAKRAKSSCGSVVNHTLGALGMLIFNAQCASGCSYAAARSEEHTSELQSLRHLVCRLLLEKKKTHTKVNSKYQRKGILKETRKEAAAI